MAWYLWLLDSLDLRFDVPGRRPWQPALGTVFLALGVVAALVGGVVSLRSGAGSRNWFSPSLVLSHAQRRSLGEQIRGRRPVEPARLPLLIELARYYLDQRATVGICLGLALSQVGSVVGRPSPYQFWSSAPLLVFSTAGVAYSLRRVHWGRRFLAAHPMNAGAG